MDTVQDFEDLLELFDRHEVHYLIIGGLAFIFHAKPRYTKDMDIWLGEDAGSMTEDRFIELTKEVLRADRRYHVALYQVMDQVVRDTDVREASFEDTAPQYEGDELSEADITRNPA